MNQKHKLETTENTYLQTMLAKFDKEDLANISKEAVVRYASVFAANLRSE